MANTSYELWWKTFLKCKECGEFKEINSENWYPHKEGYLWVLWRCKECILKWRKTEHEMNMARIRDRDRYINNKLRRDYIHKSTKERTKKHMKKTPTRNANHIKADRKIKKLWVRPKACPICWYEWRIIAHHPDINIWNEVVFCCQICHDKIHKNKIKCPSPLDLLTNT